MEAPGNFHIFDIIVLVIYFASMAAMGPLFMSKNKTTEGYFLGERSFPGWLIGFSMFAASISSITFMAYPADAYKTAWMRMVPNYMLPVGILVATTVFLPFFRRGKITSAYEYLEGRFGPNVRLYAACMYILAQTIRISMILYLVSALIQQFTGLNPMWSVIIGGCITSSYTILGGIRAVLWTDFIQALVLWVGGLICIFVIAFKLGGPFEGIAEVFRVGIADGKFAIAELNKETGTLNPIPWISGLNQKCILLLLLMGLGNWLAEYSSQQTLVQRYCASKSAKDARQAMWICCIFSVPTWALFMFLGTALYAFYKAIPVQGATDMLTGSASPEGILPFFVLNQLAPGVSGLVIAAVLAAAMSSLSASINAASSVAIIDLYRRRMVKDRDDKHYTLAAKLVSLGFGVVMMIGAAILVSAENTKTLQDTSNVLVSLSAGGLLGIYLLGFLTRTADGRAVGVGIVCTLLFTAWMSLTKFGVFTKLGLEQFNSPIDSYYAGFLGHIMMFVVGFVLGKLIPRREGNLKNMTVWDQDNAPLD